MVLGGKAAAAAGAQGIKSIDLVLVPTAGRLCVPEHCWGLRVLGV